MALITLSHVSCPPWSVESKNPGVKEHVGDGVFDAVSVVMDLCERRKNHIQLGTYRYHGKPIGSVG